MSESKHKSASRLPQDARGFYASDNALVDLRGEEFGGSKDPLADDNLRPPEYSDDALALEFAQQNEKSFRYVAAWSKWYLWDGTRWIEENTLRAYDHVRRVCREEAAACSNPKIAVAVASAKTVAAVEKLARSDRRLVATPDQWDVDSYLLNTPTVVIDLRTGAIRPHCPEDYLTKITAVAPTGACPQFLTFLRRITDDDVELQQYLARVFGYALTGTTKEHALFFFYGTGANGKSVLLNTVSAIMRDYAQTSPMETFAASNFERHPTELADLRGARLVTATETEEGRSWAEARIKAVTGGDKIRARKMRQDFSEFVPQFKLAISGNHKPSLRAVNEAIRRRFNLIPFLVTIPLEERDVDLTDKLKGEAPGILKWMLEGCRDWQRNGLNPPIAVRNATLEYLESEDLILAWIHECCQQHPDAEERSSVLFKSFKEFSAAAGEKPGTNKQFSERLEAHGLKKKRTAIGAKFYGLSLNARMTGDD